MYNNYILPDGTIRSVNTKGRIVIGDTQYPYTILKKWPLHDLNAIGIYPFREVGYDQKWLKSTGSSEEEVDGEIVKTHTTTNRYTNAEATDIQISNVRGAYISSKRRASALEDFYDAVGDNVMKKLWSDYITALKNDAKRLKDAVNAAGTYDDIINLEFQWMEAPDNGRI